MFTFGQTALTFGNRNISTNLFASSYAQWITNNWMKYPYLGFQNGAFAFGVKNSKTASTNPNDQISSNNTYSIQRDWFGSSPDQYSAEQRTANGQKIINDTTYYVSGMYFTGTGSIQQNYDNNMLSPTLNQKAYLNMITYYLSQIRPGMTDFDKFMAAFAFATNWIYYPQANDYAVTSNQGVCADYANLLTFLLNLVGVPALPMITDYLKFSTTTIHEIAWVKLHINGKDQWFCSDPTFFDTSVSAAGDLQISAPSPGTARSSFIQPNSDFPALRYILDSTSEGQFNPPTEVDEDFTYSTFWYLPWSEPYKKNSMIGEANVGNYCLYNDQDYNATNNFFFVNKQNNPPEDETPKGLNGKWNIFRQYSKFIYNNGYYYWLASTRSDYSDNNGKLNLLSCKSGGTNKDIQVVSVPDNWKFLLTDSLSSVPLLQQWNDKMIFLNRNKKELIVFKLDSNGINWNSGQTISLDPKQDYSLVCDFYIDLSGNVHFLVEDQSATDNYAINPYYLSWGDTYHAHKVVYKLTAKDIDLIYSYNPKADQFVAGDVQDAYYYYYSLGGIYALGDGNNQITLSNKQKYYQKLEAILPEAKSSNSSEQNYQLIMQMKNCFTELQNTAFKDDGADLTKSTLLNSVYSMSLQNYENYGFTNLNNFKLFTQPLDYWTQESSDSIRYDVYFSSKKPSSAEQFFKTAIKVKSDAFLPQITSNELPDPWGYYCVVGYPYNNPRQAVASNIVELVQATGDNAPVLTSGNLDILFTDGSVQYSGNTNYDPKVSDWYKKQIVLCVDWYIISNNPSWTFAVKRINPRTGEVTNVATGTGSTYSSSQRIELDTIDSSNDGLYYIEVTTNTGAKLYSDFDLILSQEDYENWNSLQWQKLIDKVSQFPAQNTNQIIANNKQ